MKLLVRILCSSRRILLLRNASSLRHYTSQQESSGGFRWGVMGALAGAGGAFVYNWRSRDAQRGISLFPRVSTNEGDKTEKVEKAGEEARKVTRRELRYQEFSSLKYEGEVYMTARDFLESVTQDTSRGHGYMIIDEKTLSKTLRTTPPITKGSDRMLRDMWNDGIFTYADYLFLLTALIKPRRQFEIVFRMIDVDGSDTVDIHEFTRMLKAVTKQRQNSLISQSTLEHSSLTVHLFGVSGKRKLSSTDLFKFIDDLQTEVREMEFNHHSMGAPTISAEQFAKILLRHTNHDIQEVVDRLRNHPSPSTMGITFSQFNDFCQLLNALDDFAIAMTMYTIAGKPITEDEFVRASQVCIGKQLDKHLVHSVFQIFDLDGDGKLSHREFLSVMKNWRLRGMQVQETKRLGPVKKFKECIKIEMRNQ